MRKIILSLIGVMLSVCAFGQIGYQVALVDQSTGKARVNETVSVTLTLSDNDGGTICTSTQSATTNEFGILSVTVGSASTFDNVDWSKLPLWIEARVGNVIVGKSQVLTVPVAEHAKHTGTLTKEILTSKTWYLYEDIYETRKLQFGDDGTMIRSIIKNVSGEVKIETTHYDYYIDANMVILSAKLAASDETYFNILFYNKNTNSLGMVGAGIAYK